MKINLEVSEKGVIFVSRNKNNNIMEMTSVYIVYATDVWGEKKRRPTNIHT